MAYKDSACFGCTERTSTCHTTCPFGIAEAQQRADERRRRLTTALAEYNGNRGTDGQIQYGRAK